MSLSTVYVFDGTRWSAGPRLPLPVDHAAAATLDDHVYLAGGHSNGADSARLFRLDCDSILVALSRQPVRLGLLLVLGRLALAERQQSGSGPDACQ